MGELAAHELGFAGEDALDGGVVGHACEVSVYVFEGAQVDVEELGPGVDDEEVGVGGGGGVGDDPVAVLQVLVDEGEALLDGCAGVGFGFFDDGFVREVGGGAEQGFEEGVDVGVEEGEPAVEFGAGFRALVAGQERFGVQVDQVIEDGHVLGEGPALVFQRGYGAEGIYGKQFG